MSSTTTPSTRLSNDKYVWEEEEEEDDDYYDYDEIDDYENDDYKEKDTDPMEGSETPVNPYRTGYSYYDNNNNEEDEDDEDEFPVDSNTFHVDVLEWESCDCGKAGTAHVLLPPNTALPSCIVHFVGGTLFGSEPTFWYKALLEDLVIHTKAAVVATSIPVNLPFLTEQSRNNKNNGAASPLDHIALISKIQRQFHTAYKTILEDEYGNLSTDDSTFKDDTMALDALPVIGMGHSLGARLLVVQSTLPRPVSSPTRRRRSSTTRKGAPNYKSYILLSFTNYGAAIGIPGVRQLLQASFALETETSLQSPAEERPRSETRPRQTSRKRSKRRRRGDNDDWWDDDEEEEDDEDLSEVWQDLQGIWQEQTLKLRKSLTPSSSELELYPTPDQLWKALIEDKRYGFRNHGKQQDAEGKPTPIQETLIVQFDNDRIDQSAKLAVAISSDSSVDKKGDEALDRHVIKFARLRGTHVTPIAVSRTKDDRRGGRDDASWLERVNASAGPLVMKLLTQQPDQTRSSEESLLELRQTITRFITEIVTKD